VAVTLATASPAPGSKTCEAALLIGGPSDRLALISTRCEQVIIGCAWLAGSHTKLRARVFWSPDETSEKDDLREQTRLPGWLLQPDRKAEAVIAATRVVG
jgi:hypothetical protein